jgi:hypothetical protein
VSDLNIREAEERAKRLIANMSYMEHPEAEAIVALAAAYRELEGTLDRADEHTAMLMRRIGELEEQHKDAALRTAMAQDVLRKTEAAYRDAVEALEEISAKDGANHCGVIARAVLAKARAAGVQ